MSAEFRGNQINALVRQTGDSLNQLEDGTWEGEVVYICRWDRVLVLAPKRNIASHPNFPTLVCKSCRVTRLKPGVVCQLNVLYRGFFGDEDDPEVPDDELGNSTEEVITSTSEQPIETHPDFVGVLGGTKDSPLNGAVFDNDGKFTGFKADSQYAGVDSYLVPSTIYRKSTPSRSRPGNIGPVGTIQSPGVGGGQAGSNWMYTCRSWQRDGGVYTVTDEYMLSGPNGWDPSIYSG